MNHMAFLSRSSKARTKPCALCTKRERSSALHCTISNSSNTTRAWSNTMHTMARSLILHHLISNDSQQHLRVDIMDFSPPSMSIDL